MKNGVEYTGIVDSVKIAKKAIKGVEDEKIYKQVGVVKVSLEYYLGSLSSLVDPIVVEDNSYDKCSWGPRVGSYKLTVNSVEAKVRINNILKTNKDDESKISITFETEELDFISAIGIYVKDKDTHSVIKLDYLSSEQE
jgi:hypothetical protein